VRNRDQRFPAADESGRYRVAAVLALLELRELEKMTDTEFNHEERTRRAEVLAAFAPGGPLACLGAGGRSAIAGCTLRTRQDAIADAKQELNRFLRGR
jgi:hypothetical protein